MGWLGAGLGAKGVWGAQATRACGRGAYGRQADAGRRRARRALGAPACWASGRRRGRSAGRSWAQAWARGALGVSAWGARRGRAGARGVGVPVRMVGMLAGSARPVRVLMNLAQF